MTTTAHTPARRHRALGDQRWQDDAVCQSTEYNPVDPETFFPEPDETDKIATAKALCAQCPVRRTCLDAALETRDTWGVRGGLTEEERAPLHENLALRLDYSRVNDTIAGRDVHLTKAERRAVVFAAYRHGVSEQRLAWLLKVTEEHAQKLYRGVRRALRNRNMEDNTITAPPADTGPAAASEPRRDDFGTAA
ncbi:WhiB family transcriptional regulator [Streptomyces sp. SID11385]|uniref:WhiB family transcriptional regulator n=1 Tax=Streptomyces sp. SID11385 TaxID=2706031 RepID=UPI0013CA9704|nr:WhiB family transcriptional regulator [Streptomyces sp. SID11385]NEA39876.1 WhiB family transcriptional regulator [Streptomyces sp. SID11385]